MDLSKNLCLSLKTYKEDTTMKLTDQQFKDYLLQIRELAEGTFDEMQKEIEVTNTFPPEFYETAIKNDLYRFALPEKYGGFGLSEKQILMVQEEFSRGPGGMRMHLHHAADLDWRILDDFGSDELKAQYMDKFQDKTIYVNFALTERTGGTGADLHTLAIKDPEDPDYYIINGEKTLISHTDCSDFTYLIVKTDPTSDKDESLSAFFVDVKTPGFEIIPMSHMMGCRGAGHADLKFTNMRVHKKFMLGKEGQGFKIAMQALDGGRIGIAAQSVGLAQGALDAAIKYCKERKQFGKPITAFQNTQFRMAEDQANINAARLLTWQAAVAKDNHENYNFLAAQAKLFAATIANDVCRHAVQYMGGYGYCREYGVERLLRDVKITEIYEGTSEVQKMVMSGNMLR
jgi:alkylation response protein AidB-like acyl-CoA dehydrogenase